MEERGNQKVQAAYEHTLALYGKMQEAYKAAMQIFNRIHDGDDSPSLREEYALAFKAYGVAQADYKEALQGYKQMQLVASAPQASSMPAPQPPGTAPTGMATLLVDVVASHDGGGEKCRQNLSEWWWACRVPLAAL